MSTRTERVEARVAPELNKRIRFAASLEDTSVSAFIVDAAVAKADQVIAESTETILPADYFDNLITALDEPALMLSGLQRAARRGSKNRIERSS